MPLGQGIEACGGVVNASVTVSTETLRVISHTLTVAMSNFAIGFGAIANALEAGTMPVSDVALMARSMADHASVAAKEMSA